MKKSTSGIIKKIFSITDTLAGVCLFSVMALVLANIIMRNVFKLPITGTIEIVGLLIVTGLGLALANCELADSNIGLDIEIKWFSRTVAKIIEAASYLLSLVFWAVVVWRIFIYAHTTYVNGRVTSTAMLPLYPFIFILGFNVFCLCVVLAYKLVRTVKGAPEESAEEGKGEDK